MLDTVSSKDDSLKKKIKNATETGFYEVKYYYHIRNVVIQSVNCSRD